MMWIVYNVRRRAPRSRLRDAHGRGPVVLWERHEGDQVISLRQVTLEVIARGVRVPHWEGRTIDQLMR